MILTDMSQAELIAQVQAMQAKLEAARKASQRKLTLKVSEKGALSLYGLGRFPVTLYKGQWERLIGEIEHVKEFIETNGDLLASKE